MHDSKICEPNKQESGRKRNNDSFLRSYRKGVPLVTLCYVVFYMVYVGEAWGRRGDVKPLWLQLGRLLVFPTYFIPIPLVSAVIVGMGYGFFVVLIARVLMGITTAAQRESS